MVNSPSLYQWLIVTLLLFNKHQSWPGKFLFWQPFQCFASLFTNLLLLVRNRIPTDSWFFAINLSLRSNIFFRFFQYSSQLLRVLQLGVHVWIYFCLFHKILNGSFEYKNYIFFKENPLGTILQKTPGIPTEQMFNLLPLFFMAELCF